MRRIFNSYADVQYQIYSSEIWADLTVVEIWTDFTCSREMRGSNQDGRLYIQHKVAASIQLVC